MHSPDLLYRLQQQRATELTRKAEANRRVRQATPALRERVARSLIALAHRLSPEVQDLRQATRTGRVPEHTA